MRYFQDQIWGQCSQVTSGLLLLKVEEDSIELSNPLYQKVNYEHLQYNKMLL